MKWERERRDSSAGGTAAAHQEWGTGQSLAGIQSTSLAPRNKPFYLLGSVHSPEGLWKGRMNHTCAWEQGTLVDSIVERGFCSSPV